jgi:hypothetical protein
MSQRKFEPDITRVKIIEFNTHFRDSDDESNYYTQKYNKQRIYRLTRLL